MQQLPPGFVIDEQPHGNTIITKRVNPIDRQKSELELEAIRARLGDMTRDNARQDREFDYRRERDAKDDARKETAGSGKPMRQGDADKLAEQVDSYSYLKDAMVGFQDDYAGNKLTGNLENTAQSILGTGTPGQSEWWANFRTADNLIRNSLFGASLTEGEKKAYEDTTISPSMTPDKVRANLERRSEITRKALARRVGRLRTVFNNEEIDAAVGEFTDDFASVTPLKNREVVPAQTQRNQETPAGSAQGPDRSNRDEVLFGTPSSDSQNGGFVPYGAQSRMEPNPQFKGMNAAVKGMIVAGRPAQEIKAFMNSKGIAGDAARGIDDAINYYRKTGKSNFGVDVENMSVPMSGFEQFRNNAPQTSVGTALATAGNAGGFGIPQMLAGGEGLDYLRSQNPVSAFAGDVAGVIGGTALLGKAGANVAGRLAPSLLGGGSKAAAGRQLATDATYGGIYGATTEGDPLTGALTAAAGSAGGQVIGKGFQKGLQGVTDPAVQYLTQRGIPLTLGQTLGNRGMIGKTMNKLESLPVVGDMMAARRIDGLQAFEREALNDVVAPVGGSVQRGGAEGLEQAQGMVGDAYGRALDGVNIPGDQQFIGEAGAALSRGRQIPTMGDQFEYGMKQRIGPLFEGGQLSGREFQAATQNLRKMGSGFRKQGAMGDFADEAVGEMDTALQGLVGRQAPDVLPKFNAANEAFRKLAPFENARIGAINQEAISPAQLARAITTGNKNFGGRGAAARGDQLTDLVKYGQEVLPSTVPDSGTAGRIGSMLLPAALGGSALGVSTMTENPGTAGFLATLAAMSTKQGQKALQKALTSRPSSVRKVGGLFGSRKAQQALGSAGAGTFISYNGN